VVVGKYFQDVYIELGCRWDDFLDVNYNSVRPGKHNLNLIHDI